MDTPLGLLKGDCLALLATFPDNSIDSIVTDPPYELGFMGKSWDNSGIAYNVELWTECLRVLKPGGHLLAFGGSRTVFRVGVAIEDAGFELRDCISWIYGSGFPKSLNVAKAITAQEKTGGSQPKNLRQVRLGADYEPTGQVDYKAGRAFSSDIENDDKKTELTENAKVWDGWGTALKPSQEIVVVARTPIEGTVAANVLKWGTGAINIDGCRVPTDNDLNGGAYRGKPGERNPSSILLPNTGRAYEAPIGRWPANIIFDEEAAAELDLQSGDRPSPWIGNPNPNGHIGGRMFGGSAQRLQERTKPEYRDTGGASRFFYCAKASKAERNAGLEGLPERVAHRYSEKAQGPLPQQTPRKGVVEANFHPTVKPLALMRYLVKLVTPPGGTVLDPFLGSGTTAVGAILEGFNWVGCEMTPEYWPIIDVRVKWAEREVSKTPPTLFQAETLEQPSLDEEPEPVQIALFE